MSKYRTKNGGSRTVVCTMDGKNVDPISQNFFVRSADVSGVLRKGCNATVFLENHIINLDFDEESNAYGYWLSCLNAIDPQTFERVRIGNLRDGTVPGQKRPFTDPEIANALGITLEELQIREGIETAPPTHSVSLGDLGLSPEEVSLRETIRKATKAGPTPPTDELSPAVDLTQGLASMLAPEKIVCPSTHDHGVFRCTLEKGHEGDHLDKALSFAGDDNGAHTQFTWTDSEEDLRKKI